MTPPNPTHPPLSPVLSATVSAGGSFHEYCSTAGGKMQDPRITMHNISMNELTTVLYLLHWLLAVAGLMGLWLIAGGGKMKCVSECPLLQ